MNGLIKKIIDDYNTVLSREIPRKSQLILLTIIVALHIGIRLFSIQTPNIDRTHWKEIDYIAISTNYWHNGYDFFKPEISWPAEPPYVTAMEFPLTPYLTALIYPLFGFNEYTVRFLSLLTGVLLILYLFKLTRLELGSLTALVAAFTASILTTNHPFSKYLFSEPTMIFLSVFSIYNIDSWLVSNKKKYFTAAVIGYAFTLALKPTAMYLMIPIVWLFFRKYKLRLKEYRSLLMFLFLSLLLPVAWYAYAFYLTQNSIDVFGIFEGHNKFQTFSMLSGIEWYRIMYKRIVFEIMGNAAVAGLFALGFLGAALVKKLDLFFFYLVAVIAFFMIVAEGNIDAPYRQLTIIPPASVFISSGIIAVTVIAVSLLKNYAVLRNRTGLFNPGIYAFVIILLMFLAAGNYRHILLSNNHKPVHTDSWLLAKEIKKYAGSGARIITTGEYSIHVGGNDLSPVLYYYSDTKGWTLNRGQWKVDFIDSLRQKGAELFAAYRMFREPESYTFLEEMKKKFRTLYENKEKSLLLLDLREPRPEGKFTFSNRP